MVWNLFVKVVFNLYIVFYFKVMVFRIIKRVEYGYDYLKIILFLYRREVMYMYEDEENIRICIKEML